MQVCLFPYGVKLTLKGLFSDAFNMNFLIHPVEIHLWGFIFVIKPKNFIKNVFLRGRVKFPIDGDEAILSP
ncbi:hypothetical protein GCM10011384_17440 [Psychrobacillus lasiicapitis]|nr:hypothetical protein GCM10011384_17440 [Psychrobacillus lasiicapitis]